MRPRLLLCLALCAMTAATALVAQSPAVSDRDWKRWIEDVKPLMVAAERNDASKTPAVDRETFREAFWAKRNPTPQAAENPVRKEYEQRVSAADKRYRNGANGSWNDCGRTFVLLGPPDRITSSTGASHFQGDRLAAMRDQDDTEAERWQYRNSPRLPQAPEGFNFRFTTICESMNSNAFGRLLEQVAATYVVNPK